MANSNESINGNRILVSDEIDAVIPMPIQVVIDDVGWWSGNDGSKNQEPYRTGISRNHVPADYDAIVELGRKLSIRPQAAMVIGEWDKNNILKELPKSTWMGKNWDNSKWVGPWMEEAAHIIRNSSEYFEFTLHGIGHEYWETDKFTRAEWSDDKGTMRPLGEVEKHLDYFERIMAQHNLGSFPVSFVPTAFNHGFGVTGRHNVSLAKVLKKRGIAYINTPFNAMHNTIAIEHGVFGFDAGVMTIDRGNDLLDWNITGEAPNGALIGPTCGMHWANLIHPNPSRNSEIVDKWVELLSPYNERLETMLVHNSSFFQRQLAHNVCTKIKVNHKTIELDFRETDELSFVGRNNQLVLKIMSMKKLDFEVNGFAILSQQSIKEEQCQIYTLTLKRIGEKDKASINCIFQSK